MVWSAEQCGAVPRRIEGERLFSLFHLDAYYGLRRSELCGLCWADVDLATRRVHVRQAQVDDELDSTKCEDSERVITVDQATADVLRAWRKAQLAERLAWAAVWTDTGRVFTREDGTPLRPGCRKRAVRHAGTPGLACPPSASTISATARPRCCSPRACRRRSSAEMLGHATCAFTMDVYTEVAEEMAEAAAVAIAAFIPRRAKTVPNGGRK